MILDEFHVLEECREKAGRRDLGRPRANPVRVDRLVFESESPQSVAELVFRRPRAESSCVVRGQLFVGGSPCRLECQLNWRRPARVDVRARNRSEPGVDSRPSLDPGTGGSGRLASVGAPFRNHEAARGAARDRRSLRTSWCSSSVRLDGFGGPRPARTASRSSGRHPDGR